MTDLKSISKKCVYTQIFEMYADLGDEACCQEDGQEEEVEDEECGDESSLVGSFLLEIQLH